MRHRIPEQSEIESWRARWSDELVDAVARQLVEGARDGSAETVRRTLVQLNRSLAEVTRYFLLNRMPHRFVTTDPRGMIHHARVLDPEHGWVEIEIPALDLRGIPWPAEVDASRCKLPLVRLQGAVLDGATFDAAELQDVDLSGASLQRARFASADLRGAGLALVRGQGVSFHSARLVRADLRHSNLFAADLRGADLTYAHLEGASLRTALVGAADSPDAQTDPSAQTSARVTRFADTSWLLPFTHRFRVRRYQERTGRMPVARWGWEAMSSRWFHTDMMGVDIDRADTRKARDLEQFVRDQQKLRQRGEHHPHALGIWMLLSDGGLAWRRHLLAAALVVFGYGGLYWFLALPAALRWDSWFAAPFLVPPGMVWGRLNDALLAPLLWSPPPVQAIVPPPSGPWTSWLYWHWVSLDVFAHIGLPVIASATGLGWLLVVSENLLGLAILALLGICLASRLARRWF